MSAQSALNFCKEYVELAGDVAGLGKAFLIAALVLGIIYAIVETIRKYTDPVAPRTRAVAGTGAIKELIDALKGFLEALAKAPAWIALFGIGLLVFWAAGASVPEQCVGELNRPYAETKAAERANPSAPDADASREGDARPRREGDGLPNNANSGA
jgi:hypothetical protein